MLSTHDKQMIPCIQTNSIDRIWNYCDLESAYNDLAAQHMKLRWADVVLINEAQFFDDLVPCVLDMLKENKKIYLYGLDGDFQRKKFGGVLDLIPYSDATRKKTSLCHYCKNGEPGIFTMRLTGETQQMLIGTDNYVPVCRECYEKRVTQTSYTAF
jgi:thymidine kinase